MHNFGRKWNLILAGLAPHHLLYSTNIVGVALKNAFDCSLIEKVPSRVYSKIHLFSGRFWISADLQCTLHGVVQ